MKVVLLGYMASGKSVIGKKLAKKMNYPFFDLDSFIEKKENRSITKIFENSGEVYFRKAETNYLNELLNLEDNCVISLGGGTPCYGNNMSLVNDKSVSFFLSASIHTIFERLKNETADRPLVASIGEENLKEFIAKHLFERNPFYSKAQYTITTDKKEINEIVNELISLF
jgi:shikimate kinase